MTQRIASPCVGLCSTTVGDTACRGCQRSDSEIRDWFAYDDDERRRRMAELDGLRVAIAGEFLQVTSAETLEVQLVRHRVRFRENQPPLSRAVELLRVGRTRIVDLTRYGLQPCGKGLSLSADEMYESISLALLEHAQKRSQAQRLDQPI
ncbi:DUF1289 domain-containing protein [Halomonas sp. McH1-25]|uniref:DUF1289 domain-containing protein n=1 Tax=unclassified Halomonas TaxID=2609666 RepID=UPI001EF42CBD|nr:MULTISPECIES: DUF1289 domain-containing protein [unclassified Halomonas]MCG7598693.1 DUF1289 domain-containing protein [Halomonas sp. McH1-25]MCP1340656.1 DUF1289 domain-containing protein [Halomonas sp. FL8]MCP1359427.1 DUF1289 domain-containing protein [Halomonas sp. BBD45]MCP1366201.1 DUF1289 domain-containing protein [Halomonas sp. BBD48]